MRPSDWPPIGALKVDAATGKPLKVCTNLYRGVSCDRAQLFFRQRNALQIVDGWELTEEQTKSKTCKPLCSKCAAQADCVDGATVIGGGNGSFTAFSICQCTPKQITLNIAGVSASPYNVYNGYCVSPSVGTVSTDWNINGAHCVRLGGSYTQYFGWSYSGIYPCNITRTGLGAGTFPSTANIDVSIFLDCRHLPAVAPADYSSDSEPLMARVCTRVLIFDGTGQSFQSFNFSAVPYPAYGGNPAGVLHGSGTTTGDYDPDDPFVEMVCGYTEVTQDHVNLWRNLYLGESNGISNNYSYYNAHLSTGVCKPDFTWSGSVSNKLTGNVITLAGSNGACSYPTHTDENVYGGGGSATISFPTGDDCADCEGYWNDQNPGWCVIVWLMVSYDNGLTWWWYRETPESSSSASSPSSLSSDSSSGSNFHTSVEPIDLASDGLSSGEMIESDGTDFTLGAYQSFTAAFTDYPVSPVDELNGNRPYYYWNQWRKSRNYLSGYCQATYFQVIGPKQRGRRCDIQSALANRPARFVGDGTCIDPDESSASSPSSASSVSSSSKSSVSSNSSSSSSSSSSSTSSNHHGGGGSDGGGGGTIATDCLTCPADADGQGCDLYRYYAAPREDGSGLFDISGPTLFDAPVVCPTDICDGGWSQLAAEDYIKYIWVCHGTTPPSAGAVGQPPREGDMLRRPLKASAPVDEFNCDSRQKAVWAHEENTTRPPPDIFRPITDEMRQLMQRRLIPQNGELPTPMASTPRSATPRQPCLPCQRKRPS